MGWPSGQLRVEVAVSSQGERWGQEECGEGARACEVDRILTSYGHGNCQNKTTTTVHERRYHTLVGSLGSRCGGCTRGKAAIAVSPPLREGDSNGCLLVHTENCG